MLNIDAALAAKSPDFSEPAATPGLSPEDAAHFSETLARENRKLDGDDATSRQHEDAPSDNVIDGAFPRLREQGVSAEDGEPSPVPQNQRGQVDPWSPAAWLLGLTWRETAARQDLPGSQESELNVATAAAVDATEALPADGGAPANDLDVSLTGPFNVVPVGSPLDLKETPAAPGLLDAPLNGVESESVKVGGEVGASKVQTAAVPDTSTAFSVTPEPAPAVDSRTVQETPESGDATSPRSASEPFEAGQALAQAAPDSASVLMEKRGQGASVEAPGNAARRMERKQRRPQPPAETLPEVVSSAPPSEETSVPASVRTVASLENALGLRREVDPPAARVPAPAKPENPSRQEASRDAAPAAPSVPIPVDVPADTSRQNRGERQPHPRDLEIQVMARPAASREPLAVLNRSAEDIAPSGKAVGEMASASGAGSFAQDLRGPVDSFAAVVARQVESRADQWTQIERSDVLSQLVEKARDFRWEKDSEVVVSLHPESLGRISLRASLVDRTMVATISAESDRVRHLIQVELPVIQKALHDGGVVARVEVSHQDYLSFTQNNAGNGQSRFRHPNTPVFIPEPEGAEPLMPLTVSADSRYSSNSVHLIA